MIPRSVSASALGVADKCLKRYQVQHIDRIPTVEEETAATLGTTVHWALENYVQLTQMEKKAPAELDTLEMLYQAATNKFFVDIPEEVYDDGWNMLKTWHARTDFTGVEVLSTEVKETFQIK